MSAGIAILRRQIVCCLTALAIFVSGFLAATAQAANAGGAPILVICSADAGDADHHAPAQQPASSAQHCVFCLASGTGLPASSADVASILLTGSEVRTDDQPGGIAGRLHWRDQRQPQGPPRNV